MFCPLLKDTTGLFEGNHSLLFLGVSFVCFVGEVSCYCYQKAFFLVNFMFSVFKGLKGKDQGSMVQFCPSFLLSCRRPERKGELEKLRRKARFGQVDAIDCWVFCFVLVFWWILFCWFWYQGGFPTEIFGESYRRFWILSLGEWSWEVQSPTAIRQ